jgi:hypothetical protein
VNVLRPASEASMATAGIIEAGHRLYQMLGQ